MVIKVFLNFCINNALWCFQYNSSSEQIESGRQGQRSWICLVLPEADTPHSVVA